MERSFGNSRLFRCGLGGIKRHAMNRLILCLTLLCAASAAFAEPPDADVPKVAVYIADQETDELKMLSTLILEAFVNSEKYVTIERSKNILQQLTNEHIAQRSGDVDDSQIKRLGKQAGVDFVCVIAATPVFGVYQVSSRLINVETARVTKIGVTDSPLRSSADVNAAASVLVDRMLNPRNPLKTAANEVVGTMLGVPRTVPPPPPLPPPPLPPPPPPPGWEPEPYVQPTAERQGAGMKKRYYFNVAAPVLASPPFTGEWAAIGFGWIEDNGMAYGLEFGGGFFGESHRSPTTIMLGYRESIGGGFNISHMSKRWILGVSMGYWYGCFELDNYNPPLQTIHVFGGPFINLRCWKVCEFDYRGLMGYKQDGRYNPFNSTFVSGSEKEFTFASQFKFGLRFEIGGGDKTTQYKNNQQAGGYFD